jgi:hypothetical protein
MQSGVQYCFKEYLSFQGCLKCVPLYLATWLHMSEVYSLNICCYENCVSLLIV